ncbi:MAG: hypothetical protein CFE29_17955 [Bradyrhizobiaceae bacterium PARB1]|nr:MAG: hypothetical protein CFE29_17955 [Bradyrhizobiaceae bacterium PARB1]
MVFTGYSIGGLFHSNSYIVTLLFSALSSGKSPSARSYYSMRTVCQSCDRELEEKQIRRFKQIGIGVAVAVILFFAFIFAGRG